MPQASCDCDFSYIALTCLRRLGLLAVQHSVELLVLSTDQDILQ